VLILVPVGAHLFELPNKLALPPQDYMTVQRIYRGWTYFGTLIFPALLLLFVQTLMLRRNAAAAIWSFLAFLLIAGTQAIFWLYTFPMNRLTSEWTETPDQFEAARLQWELSHAVNAVLTLVGFAALMISILTSRRFAFPPLPATRNNSGNQLRS
jgi:hypothetical protein